MKNIFPLLLVAAVFFGGCNTPNIMLSDELKSNTQVYEVKGRQGWQINQVIRFGEYKTSKVKRGWTRVYNYPFLVRFRGASEKLNFQQYTPEGDSAIVHCVSQFDEKDVNIVRDFFDLVLERQHYFAGSVNNENIHWDFIIHEPEGQFEKDLSRGEILNVNNKFDRIAIRAVKKVEGQSNWVTLDVHGFEFVRKGESIAAVSLINHGRVWMKEGLDAETKLVVSSVMTGLMVRHSMTEAIRE